MHFPWRQRNVVGIADGAAETWHIQWNSGCSCPRPMKPAWKGSWTLDQLQSSSPEGQFALSGSVEVRAGVEGGKGLLVVYDCYCPAVRITPGSPALYEVPYEQSKVIAPSACVRILGSCLLYLTLQ